jgi:hypothetical protein
MELWIVRGLGVALAMLSAFGFLNAFFLRLHGPGGDLGVLAGLLAVGAFAWAHFIRKNP